VVEPILEAPFEEGQPIGITHLRQSSFEGAHNFRMQDFWHFNIMVNTHSNPEAVDGA
jgi:hypothetical protein